MPHTLRYWLLFAVFLFIADPLCSQTGWRTGESEVRVTPGSIRQIRLIDSLNINYEISSVDGSEWYCYVIPEELKLLQAAGIACEVLINDLNSYYRGYWEHLVPPGYHTYEEIIALADSLAMTFPSICRKFLYGTSLGGRQLAALKISDNAEEEEPEPEILFDGGCHGNEIGGPENLIRFARDLCLRYGTDSAITNLVDNREIWLFLMVNPDGRVNMSRFNEAMVDINRDYGYMWDASGGSTGAFSQPETQALRQCILDHRFAVYISYHSGIEQAAYPWAYRGEEPRDKVNLRKVAKAYSDSSLYPNLLYGQSYTIMYQANGMSIDYNYGTTGQACITMELSVDKHPPDPLVYYDLNYPAMLEMIRIAGCGVTGTVTDSLSGSPVDAAIWVDSFFPVYTDPGVGDFHKYLLPGTHTLKVTANGYKTEQGILFNVPQTGSAQVNILLSPDPAWYAHKVSSCRIPGDNVQDEGYTPGSLSGPDSISYSLGKGGWIVLDLGDTVQNAEGNELTVYGLGPPEGFDCYCANSPDGPWLNLGSGSGTSSFDLGSIASARFLKLVDDGDGLAGAPDAGFDLDAVKVIPGLYTAVTLPVPPLSVNIFPNPSAGLFTIILSGDRETEVTVLDLTGRKIFEKTCMNGRCLIDLSSNPEGVYYFMITGGDKHYTGKLIKLN